MIRTKMEAESLKRDEITLSASELWDWEASGLSGLFLCGRSNMSNRCSEVSLMTEGIFKDDKRDRDVRDGFN